MGNSKIVYYGETLIDLTGDTVEAAKLLMGVTAHDKKGEKITGTFEAADPYAIIGVTYPSESICTCTNGTLTLTAKGTGGKAMFVIPSAGTWTVKAVKGSQSASRAVSITFEGQVETVELPFARLIFKNGVFTEVTGASRLSYGEVSIQDGCIYYNNSDTNQYGGLTLNNAVTLKSSETIRVHIVSGDTYTDNSCKPRVVICDAKPTGIDTETGNPSGTHIIASKTLNTSGSTADNQNIPEQTVEIPVGSVAGSRYIAALISDGRGVLANLKIAEISIWP